MTKIKDRALKAAREKQEIIYTGTPIRISAHFSAEILQARRKWHDTWGKKKSLQSKYFTQQSSHSDLRENQKLYRQVKVNRIQHHETSFTTNAKETSLDGKKGPNWKQENYGMKNLIRRGKHTAKIGNHPHIKIAGKFKNKSSKITCIYNKQLSNIQNNWM